MKKIKQNIYGNWSGYIGRNKVEEFGTEGIAAAYWLLTGKVDFYMGYSEEFYKECKKVLDRM